MHQKILVFSLGVLVLTSLAISLHVLWMRDQIRTYAAGSTVTVTSGVRLDGARWAAQLAPCHVIRVTMDECPYCKSDQAAYDEFVRAANLASCEVVEFAPKAGDLAERARNGVVQLKYVDADIGPGAFPIVTPMTFIVDGAWTIKWMRRGTFTSSALSEAIGVLQRQSE